MAEEWAKKNDVKFPPIDAEEQFKKYGMKELYVFRHPIDPSCPIVMHFVMVNLTFREESAPGKNLLKNLVRTFFIKVNAKVKGTGHFRLLFCLRVKSSLRPKSFI